MAAGAARSRRPGRPAAAAAALPAAWLLALWAPTPSWLGYGKTRGAYAMRHRFRPGDDFAARLGRAPVTAPQPELDLTLPEWNTSNPTWDQEKHCYAAAVKAYAFEGKPLVYHPYWGRGPVALTDPKKPATFEAISHIRIRREPTLDSESIPDRIVKKGTVFSCVEIVHGGQIETMDVMFFKPKKPFYFEARPEFDEGLDVGEGGWLAAVGTERDTRMFKRPLVKRVRMRA